MNSDDFINNLLIFAKLSNYKINIHEYDESKYYVFANPSVKLCIFYNNDFIEIAYPSKYKTNSNLCSIEKMYEFAIKSL